MIEEQGKLPEVQEDTLKDEKAEEQAKEPTHALDRAEAANKEKAKLLEKEEALQKRKEELHAKQMVGGKTDAGNEPIVKTDDEKVTEEADALMQGHYDEGTKLSDPTILKKDDPKPISK